MEIRKNVHDNFMANPGLYYAQKSFYDRGYWFNRVYGEKYTAESCHLPKGATFLTAFTSKVPIDNNMIVFYYEGDKDKIEVLYRIMREDPFGIWILSIPVIDQIVKHGAPLPSIFDSSSGRWIEDRDLDKYAHSGYNRANARVFKRAENGKVDLYDGQYFLVEFANGDKILSIGDHLGSEGTYRITAVKYVTDEKEHWRGYRGDHYTSMFTNNELYKAWVKEQGITEHNLPPDPPPVNNFNNISNQVKPPESKLDGLLKWFKSFGK